MKIDPSLAETLKAKGAITEKPDPLARVVEASSRAVVEASDRNAKAVAQALDLNARAVQSALQAVGQAMKKVPFRFVVDRDSSGKISSIIARPMEG